MMLFSRALILWSLLVVLLFSCAKDEQDYGQIWVQLPTQLDLQGLTFVSRDTGYAVAGGHFTDGMVFETTDGGLSWDTFLVLNRGATSISQDGQKVHYCEAGNRFTSFNRTGQIEYKTTTGWWSWHAHHQLNSGKFMVAGGYNFANGFIHIMDPNGGFMLLDTFLRELRDVEVTSDGRVHLCGYGLYLYSDDEGQNWNIQNIQGDFYRGMDFVDNEHGYMLGEYGSVYKTENGGADWVSCRLGNSVFADQEKLMRDIAFRDLDRGYIVGTGNELYSTLDAGSSWAKIDNTEQADFLKIDIFYDKAFLSCNSGRMLILNLP